jgi:serine/threonine protein phosphatase 1
MATVAIGDIHGNLRALNHLLLRLKDTITSADTVVFLGDLIDGYPDSRGCIERVLQFQSESPSRTVSIMGNHEEWLLETMKDPTRHSWILSMKGLTTIGSYSKEVEELLRNEMKNIGPSLINDHLPLSYDAFFQAVPEAHKNYIGQMVGYYRDGQTMFVHGGVSKNYTKVENEDGHVLRWGYSDFPDGYAGNDTIVYGHNSDRAILRDEGPFPGEKNNTICIDTVKYGVLTAISMPSRKVIQSNKFQY